MDILYAKSSTESPALGQTIQILCNFYGIKLLELDVTDNIQKYPLHDFLKAKELKAIVITGEGVSNLDSNNILQLARSKRLQIPILVMGPCEKSEAALLENVTDGKITNLKFYGDRNFSGFFKFTDMKDIAFELSGLILESEFTNFPWYEINEKSDVKPIIQIVKEGNDSPYGIFIQIKADDLEIFFLSMQQHLKVFEPELTAPSVNQSWIELIALAMFLRYACGDYCWHSSGSYANLSIDDPWLVEPYGYVSYSGLLSEMKKANFHTSISFIPWNYDRSEPEVVSVFRENPDKFSICIHGNNHDHYEFFKYRTKTDDPWPAKAIEDHENNIKQAIARMEEFKRISGIPYDCVMVFPHGIAPKRTLELLKKYNFLATLNINHIPLGSDMPTNLIFYLRPYTLEFGNFLSHKRLALWTKSEIALQLFLENPLLFSGHHNLFEEGVDAFNETAELVNRLQPNIQWVSLGKMVRHMYLLRRRNHSSYDVRSFSSCIEIENKYDREIVYHFRKQESFYPAIKKLTINAESLSYERSQDDLAFTFSIPQGETRVINIEYENDLQLNAIDITKNNSRANRLRRFSDFRDMTLTKFSWGRAFIKSYYGSGTYKLKIKRLVIYFLRLLVFAWSGIRALRKGCHKKLE